MASRFTTDELITVREAARRRSVSRAAIYQAIREGRLTRVQITGGGVVLSAREVEAYTPRARKQAESSPYGATGLRSGGVLKKNLHGDTAGKSQSRPKQKEKNAPGSESLIKPGSAKGMTFVMSDDFNAPIEEFDHYL